MSIDSDLEIDRKILKAISMDGRTSLDAIGKLIGLKKHATYRRLKQLEKEYGIHYVTEIDTEKLGYLKFLLFIKFLKNIPNNAEVISSIKNEPRIQFAAVMSGGNYDLMLYILAESNLEINLIRRNLIRDTKLSDYPAEIYVTPFYQYYGFIPLRSEFIDSLDESLSKQSKKFLIDDIEKPTEKKKQILKRELATLRELNNKGDLSFAEIDKKYGFDRGRSQYSYYKLKDSGVITRVTISATNVKIKYNALLLTKVTYPKKLYKTRYHLLLNIIRDTKAPINRYSLVGDIEIPFGAIMIMPILEESDIDKVQKEMLATKGMEVRYGVITRILLGKLCYRLFDNKYSVQQKVLKEQFRIVKE